MPERFDHVTFVMAEVDEGIRQHRRILARCPANRGLHGKPVVYADTFSEKEDATYVYARHTWGVNAFLRDLDDFLTDEFSESADWSVPIILNQGGERLYLDLQIPFQIALPDQNAIRFLKFLFPFGAISIEFGIPRISGSEISGLRYSRLTRALETPLIGCDVSRTELPTVLMARGHWAGPQIPREILNALLLQAAPEFV